MRIKRFTLILILNAFLFTFLGCKNEIENPDACYTLKTKSDNGTIVLVDPYVVEVGQVIDFYNCGSADYYSFFSGIPGSVWSEYINSSDAQNVGMDTNANGDFSFSYSTPGEFIATIVLTNRAFKNPNDQRQVYLNFSIKVIPVTN